MWYELSCSSLYHTPPNLTYVHPSIYIAQLSVRPAHSQLEQRKDFRYRSLPFTFSRLPHRWTMLGPVTGFRYGTPGRNHNGGRGHARVCDFWLLRVGSPRLRRHLCGPRLVDHHALPRPVSFELAQLVLLLVGLARVDD